MEDHLGNSIKDVQFTAYERKNESKFLLANINDTSKANQTVILSGHTDVFIQLPRKSESKHEPFSGKKFDIDRDVIVHGCGTSDMKGGIISICKSLGELSNSGELSNVCVIGAFSSDEETGNYQSLRKFGELLSFSSYCIIVEPTTLEFHYLGENGI